ncbi:DNA methyltransferase [Streptomyces sp. NBC_00236]|uniref:DNA methyltransferase n=1 Tax=Streptomyces sp. NBC_00236 TaxID=2903639 RepID=UPI002E2B56AB|nr:DNA methyltransferase [Streptomyces sp. NBC_00236]
MAKPLSLNEIRIRAARFFGEWKNSPGDERQDAQSFVRDLLKVYGVTETRAAFYEKRVKKASSGGQGYIDALIPGLALIEMKSAGKNLVVAEQQALDYVNGLTEVESPRWILTSDFKKFRLLDLTAPKGEDITEWNIEDFPKNSDRLAFFAGYGVRQFASPTQEQASISAAQLMAGLYESLEGSGYDDHSASVFLVRTLFALYADDSGVWERDLFLQFLTDRTSEDGSDLGAQLSMLYQVMATPVGKRQNNLDELMSRFPYVNGGVFEEPLTIPAFNAEMRGKLMDAAMYNWSSISPAIFGSLFQAVKDKKARRELGEHYTTETNILKVIGPMFLDDLRQRFADHQHDIKKLEGLREHMGRMRFLDPACGCGNFLVVAYREMRALDLAVLERLQALRGKGWQEGTMFFDETLLPVRLENFHGIELEEWPARIAATALHLVEHQANQALELTLGMGPDPLPLNKIHTIQAGNALHMDWNSVLPASNDVYVLGNPPFIGMNRMTPEQHKDNRLVFTKVDAKGLRTGRLDYVACWYAKAMDYLRHAGEARVAFVSTNSITQGEQARTMVPLLDRNGFAVDFAHQTFKWTSEAPAAAVVHCIVVGFSGKARRARNTRLFSYKDIAREPIEKPTSRLNFYLSDGPDLVPAKLTAPAVQGMPNAHKGSQPTDGGHLLVTEAEYPNVAADPNAAPYLRRFVQGKDMLQGKPLRWCLWLRDANPAHIKASALLHTRLDGVKEARLESPTESVQEYANQPGLFTQDRQPSTDYFALPEVSSENRRWIPGRFFTPETVAGNKLIIFPEADPWHAALLQSSMFMAWVETFAGRLKSDISLSPGLAYFPIPWPIPTKKQRTSLAEAWQKVEEARAAYPTSTLSDLYDKYAMPDRILSAHQSLDVAVDSLFSGRKKLLDNTERLTVLLTAYERITTAGQLAMPKARRRARN